MVKLDERNKELTALKSAHAIAAENLANDDDRAADALEFAASRLEAIAARLAPA